MLTQHFAFFLLTDGVILVDPEYLKDRKGRTAHHQNTLVNFGTPQTV